MTFQSPRKTYQNLMIVFLSRNTALNPFSELEEIQHLILQWVSMSVLFARRPLTYMTPSLAQPYSMLLQFMNTMPVFNFVIVLIYTSAFPEIPEHTMYMSEKKIASYSSQKTSLSKICKSRNGSTEIISCQKYAHLFSKSGLYKPFHN